MNFKKFPDSITIVVLILLLFVGLSWVIPAGEYQRDFVYRLDKSFGEKSKQNSELKTIAQQLETIYPATFMGEAALSKALIPILGSKQWQQHAASIKNLAQGRKVVVPGTYKQVEANPQNLWGFLLAPIKGFQKAVLIVGFVFLVGGAFGIINKTGAIEAGLNHTIRFSQENPQYKHFIIPSIMVLFSLGGATFGMSEEVLVFVMITVPLAMAMGYDSIVGVAIPFVGAGAGFAGAFSNPFTVGVAQGISNIPIFSGIEYRFVVWAVFTAVSIVYIMWYAARISKKPSLSSMHAIDSQRELQTSPQGERFMLTHKLILLALLGALVLLIVGVTEWHWYIEEISALFVGLGLVAALIYRMGSETCATAFAEGAKEMMTAALIIGLTNGMLVIATEGKIIDTILHSLATTASGLPKTISVQIMFLFQGFLNFFMPSGSGQAALTMPLMAPLSDLLGISRQTAVLAFQLGDGLFNLIIPTSGVTMGILAIANISFNKWLKWIMPLMVIFVVLSILFLLPPTLGWVDF